MAERLRTAQFWAAICRWLGGADGWLFDLEGIIASDLENYPKAVKKFRAAVFADPTDAAYKRRLAIALARAGDWAEALHVGKSLLLSDEVKSGIFAYNLASDLLNAGAPDTEVLPWFELASRLEPEHEPSKLCQAHCYMGMESPEKALPIYQTLWQNTSDGWTKCQAGMAIVDALQRLGRTDEAIEIAKKLAKDAKTEDVPDRTRKQVAEVIAWLEGETGATIG